MGWYETIIVGRVHKGAGWISKTVLGSLKAAPRILIITFRKFLRYGKGPTKAHARRYRDKRKLRFLYRTRR